jgi:hypothetical protein
MNCTICHKPIVLSPSASERAAKYGGSPSDYARLFDTHADCLISKRSREAQTALRSTANERV